MPQKFHFSRLKTAKQHKQMLQSISFFRCRSTSKDKKHYFVFIFFVNIAKSSIALRIDICNAYLTKKLTKTL